MFLGNGNDLTVISQHLRAFLLSSPAIINIECCYANHVLTEDINKYWTLLAGNMGETSISLELFKKGEAVVTTCTAL